MNVLVGVLFGDDGQIIIDGQVCQNYIMQVVYWLGVCCVFQELFLCQNFNVVENFCVFYLQLKGWGWWCWVCKLVMEKFDDIFFGYGIDFDCIVGEFSIIQCQMVEIVCVFMVVDVLVCLLIFDELIFSFDV